MSTDISNTTVVLGGGGVWGVAWMAGLLKGLADQGVDLGRAERFIGTSAGSIVSTLLACGVSVDDIYARQLVPDPPGAGLPPASPESLAQLMALMQKPWPDAGEKGRELGRLALQSEKMDPVARRAAMANRLALASSDWPAKRLSITAVDAETGALCDLTRDSGVDLVEAVAASCAVPVVWPPVLINGRYYIDGGVLRTPDNAHLAQGAQAVIVISPVGGRGPGLAAHEEDLALLRDSGSVVTVIQPDDASVASMGLNPLHPATRQPGALAGLAQGGAEADRIRAALS